MSTLEVQTVTIADGAQVKNGDRVWLPHYLPGHKEKIASTTMDDSSMGRLRPRGGYCSEGVYSTRAGAVRELILRNTRAIARAQRQINTLKKMLAAEESNLPAGKGAKS